MAIDAPHAGHLVPHPLGLEHIPDTEVVKPRLVTVPSHPASSCPNVKTSSLSHTGKEDGAPPRANRVRRRLRFVRLATAKIGSLRLVAPNTCPRLSLSLAAPSQRRPLASHTKIAFDAAGTRWATTYRNVAPQVCQGAYGSVRLGVATCVLVRVRACTDGYSVATKAPSTQDGVFASTPSAVGPAGGISDLRVRFSRRSSSECCDE